MSITGGSGDDYIYGLAGNDILTGGGGSDVFSFSGFGDGMDTITDAENQDVISFDTNIVAGRAATIGSGLYQLGATYFMKEGNNLFITSGALSGVVVNNFFSTTYDPAQDYTYMGITIPAFEDADNDGIIIPRLARGSMATCCNTANDNSLINYNKLIDSNFIPVKVA